MTADERAIRNLVDDWLALAAAGDLPKLLELMADDIVFMAPGKEAFGKQGFADWFEKLSDIRMEGVADVQEVRVLGDWGYLRNFLTVTMTARDSEQTRHSGWVLSIVRKEAGKWVVFRDANLFV